jgi:hypothetical protein
MTRIFTWIVDRITYRRRTEEMLRHFRIMLQMDLRWLGYKDRSANILINRYLEATDPQWKKFSELPREELRDLLNQVK